MSEPVVIECDGDMAGVEVVETVSGRPLVWEEIERDRGDGTTDLTGDHEAVSATGVYLIEIGFGSDCYYWSVFRDDEEIGRNFDDLALAQAAAEADHQARFAAMWAGWE